MLSVYFSVHRLQVLCNILPWDFKTHTGLILFVCYMDAYIEFLTALVSRGDCGCERVQKRGDAMAPWVGRRPLSDVTEDAWLTTRGLCRQHELLGELDTSQGNARLENNV